MLPFFCTISFRRASSDGERAPLSDGLAPGRTSAPSRFCTFGCAACMACPARSLRYSRVSFACTSTAARLSCAPVSARPALSFPCVSSPSFRAACPVFRKCSLRFFSSVPVLRSSLLDRRMSANGTVRAAAAAASLGSPCSLRFLPGVSSPLRGASAEAIGSGGNCTTEGSMLVPRVVLPWHGSNAHAMEEGSRARGPRPGEGMER